MRFGLILAAGRGERFGAPKQKVLLGGHPLALWSILAFEQSQAVDLIVMVTDEESVDFFESQIRERGIEKIEAVVPGGAERVDSLKAGLKVLPEDGLVAVHDAARPFVRDQDITKGFEFLESKGPVIYAVPSTDSLKKIHDRVIIQTLPRESIYRAQTPQFFEIGMLRKALKQAESEGFKGTDEASYVERLGDKVHVLQGREENFKVTFRRDLELAEELIKAGSCP